LTSYRRLPLDPFLSYVTLLIMIEKMITSPLLSLMSLTDEVSLTNGSASNLSRDTHESVQIE
jgi:hypothetical protein